MRAPSNRFVDELAGQLRETDFSWFELDKILRATVRKALAISGTQVVNGPKTQTQAKLSPGQMRFEELTA